VFVPERNVLTAVMETPGPGDPDAHEAAYRKVIAQHQIAWTESGAGVNAGKTQIHCACGARTGWCDGIFDTATQNHNLHQAQVTIFQPAEPCSIRGEHAIHGLCPGNLPAVVRAELASPVLA
jgi:hypothetical protein